MTKYGLTSAFAVSSIVTYYIVAAPSIGTTVALFQRSRKYQPPHRPRDEQSPLIDKYFKHQFSQYCQLSFTKHPYIEAIGASTLINQHVQIGS